MSNKLRNIFFAIGLIAIIVMLFTFDVSFKQLWRDVCKAGYWLVAMLALWGVLYAMNALTWRVILKGSGDCNISFLKLTKITITGFALNYATPVGLLGGEPYKIMELKPYVGVQRASSSVLLFAMMHIFSHFWFWITSIVVYVLLSLLGYLSLGPGMGIILFLMSLFCGAGIYLFIRGYKKGMVVKLIAMVSHIPGLRNWAVNFGQNNRENLEKIDKQISELQSQNKKSFYCSFFLEYFGRLFQSFEIMFMLILFEAGHADFITFLYSFLILSFTSLFANLLFFFPLQLGGREGGFALSTAQMGMTNDIGMFVSMMCRVRELFWASIGLLLMKVGTKAPETPTNEDTNK